MWWASILLTNVFQLASNFSAKGKILLRSYGSTKWYKEQDTQTRRSSRANNVHCFKILRPEVLKSKKV